MPIQVTIIGLGQIGASIGMALAEHSDKFFRVGHDKAFNVEREAQKRGAVEKTEHNLPNAVRSARLVILALPVTEIRETLGFIARNLQDGTVILDTAPVKAEVSKWAKELLPDNCYYVGIVPALAAEFLADKKSGLDAARPDLFSKNIFLVSAPAGTPGEAVELASNFIRYLGAVPMLADQAESDGFMATAHILPQLVSAALLNATVSQPGWNDVRKVTGRAYTAASSAVDYENEDALKMLAIHNKENMVRILDSIIVSLHDLREDIENGNETSLKERLSAAHQGREEWLNARIATNWIETQKDSPDYPSMMERLFGSIMGKKSSK